MIGLTDSSLDTVASHESNHPTSERIGWLGKYLSHRADKDSVSSRLIPPFFVVHCRRRLCLFVLPEGTKMRKTDETEANVATRDTAQQHVGGLTSPITAFVGDPQSTGLCCHKT